MGETGGWGCPPLVVPLWCPSSGEDLGWNKERHE